MYYAQYNLYGSTINVGFSNTWQVASFDTKHARDSWVAQHAERLDIQAITRAEAVKLVDRYQRRHLRLGGYLAHTHYLTDDNVRFVRAF